MKIHIKKQTHNGNLPFYCCRELNRKTTHEYISFSAVAFAVCVCVLYVLSEPEPFAALCVAVFVLCGFVCARVCVCLCVPNVNKRKILPFRCYRSLMSEFISNRYGQH